MFTIGRSARAFCFATVLAAALSGTALVAGCKSVPNGKDRLPPSTTMPGGSVAPPPAVTSTPAVTGIPAAARCPGAPYGLRSYAPGTGKTVTLTFDDGPGRSTAAILAVLTRYKVPATFFNIGVEMAGRPSLCKTRPGTGTRWATTRGITLTWCRCPRRTRPPNWTGPAPSTGP
jgi:Polysaccharide deacetylase